MRNYSAIILFAFLFYSCKDEKSQMVNTTTISGDSTYSSIKDSASNKCIEADGFDFPVGNINGKGKYTSLTDKREYDSWNVTVKTGDQFKLGIHTGEDWNGNGGGNTDFGQPVYSIASGIVLSAQDYETPLGKVVMVKHCFIENGTKRKVFSLYAHLSEIVVKTGDTVIRRQQLGAIGTGGGNIFMAHLHLEIRKETLENYPVLFWPSLEGKDRKWVLENYELPSEFIRNRRTL